MSKAGAAAEIAFDGWTEGALCVWWVPQVPMTAFHVPVADLTQAKLLLKTLADYDRFQFEKNVKPDYCNMGGLEVFRDGDWEEWESEDGDDICAIMRWGGSNEQR